MYTHTNLFMPIKYKIYAILDARKELNWNVLYVDNTMAVILSKKMVRFKDQSIEPWGGHHAPHEVLSEKRIKSIKKKLQKGKKGTKIEVHHPYYQEYFIKYAATIGKHVVQMSYHKYKHHPDSDLCLHIGCQYIAPYGQIVWQTMTNNRGDTITYFECHRCLDYINRDYKNRCNSVHGYKIIRGKNCLCLV